jgi:hypothetical protein
MGLMAEETYHGHQIVYSGDPGSEVEDAPKLQVDGQDYGVVVHSDGTYSAHEHYYAKFGSVVELGRALAAQLPDN